VSSGHYLACCLSCSTLLAFALALANAVAVAVAMAWAAAEAAAVAVPPPQIWAMAELIAVEIDVFASFTACELASETAVAVPERRGEKEEWRRE
jgi:hypothetical protein